MEFIKIVPYLFVAKKKLTYLLTYLLTAFNCLLTDSIAAKVTCSDDFTKSGVECTLRTWASLLSSFVFNEKSERKSLVETFILK